MVYRELLPVNEDLELITDIDWKDKMSILIEQRPSIMEAARDFRQETRGLFYQENRFFIAVRGPSFEGTNLKDLQHGIRTIVHMVNELPFRSLTLAVESDVFAISYLTENIDLDMVMQLATLVLRRKALITVNGFMDPAHVAFDNADDLPKIDIAITRRDDYEADIMLAESFLQN